jgi:hypothetical protein
MAKRKTAREKAQAELDLAKRIQEKATARNLKASKDLEETRARHEKIMQAKEAEAAAAKTAKDDADQRVTFLASHPALSGGKDDADTLL